MLGVQKDIYSSVTMIKTRQVKVLNPELWGTAERAVWLISLGAHSGYKTQLLKATQKTSERVWGPEDGIWPSRIGIHRLLWAARLGCWESNRASGTAALWPQCLANLGSRFYFVKNSHWICLNDYPPPLFFHCHFACMYVFVRVPAPLKLDSPTVVSCHMAAGDWTWLL